MKKCDDCDEILIKPELKAQSFSFIIKSMAMYYKLIFRNSFPRVTILPDKKHLRYMNPNPFNLLIKLSVSNPNFQITNTSFEIPGYTEDWEIKDSACPFFIVPFNIIEGNIDQREV